jgi:hypothetical protein
MLRDSAYDRWKNGGYVRARITISPISSCTSGPTRFSNELGKGRTLLGYSLSSTNSQIFPRVITASFETTFNALCDSLWHSWNRDTIDAAYRFGPQQDQMLEPFGWGGLDDIDTEYGSLHYVGCKLAQLKLNSVM